ncbi:hypothetical protein DXG01_015992 [Tephrocybe rancida]|nr:hypothetical protein DXG01_015992 [Tephrocybe rancida]
MPSEDPPSRGESGARKTDVRADGASWEGPLSQLAEQKHLVQRPNLHDPGYIRQKANNKLWVRERLVALLDQNSFLEVGSVTGKPVYDDESGTLKSFIPANSVTGFGRINGRKVFVTADDFSVRGGHADGGIQMKAPYGELLARKSRVPLVRKFHQHRQSSFAYILYRYGYWMVLVVAGVLQLVCLAVRRSHELELTLFLDLTMGATYIPGMAGLGRSMDTMAVVPVASALLGPVVGLAAAKAVLGHFNVMVKGLSQVFVTVKLSPLSDTLYKLFAAGPPVVKQATFEDLSKEALGGWEIHAQNGTVDNIADSEVDAFRQIASFLSYLPSSIFALPPVVESLDPPTRREEELFSIIPRQRARPYDVRRLIRLVVDASGPIDDPNPSTFFEIGKTWGRCIVTGFARLAGRPVGVLTSDCLVNGGAIDALGSQKSARFATLCDHFGLPLLNLVDLPGFAIGSIAERAATIRHGASAMSALYNATVPIYTVIIRRAFGVAGGVFADPEDGTGTRVAWPSGDWGSLPLEGGIEAAYKRRLDAAESAEAREELMTDLLSKFEDVRSPLKTANKFGVEEIIDPRDTRALACETEQIWTGYGTWKRAKTREAPIRGMIPTLCPGPCEQKFTTLMDDPLSLVTIKDTTVKIRRLATKIAKRTLLWSKPHPSSQSSIGMIFGLSALGLELVALVVLPAQAVLNLVPDKPLVLALDVPILIRQVLVNISSSGAGSFTYTGIALPHVPASIGYTIRATAQTDTESVWDRSKEFFLGSSTTLAASPTSTATVTTTATSTSTTASSSSLVTTTGTISTTSVGASTSQSTSNSTASTTVPTNISIIPDIAQDAGATGGDKALPIKAIIGGTLGGVALISILGLGLVLFLMRRRKAHAMDYNYSPVDPKILAASLVTPFPGIQSPQDAASLSYSRSYQSSQSGSLHHANPIATVHLPESQPSHSHTEQQSLPVFLSPEIADPGPATSSLNMRDVPTSLQPRRPLVVVGGAPHEVDGFDAPPPRYSAGAGPSSDPLPEKR